MEIMDADGSGSISFAELTSSLSRADLCIDIDTFLWTCVHFFVQEVDRSRRILRKELQSAVKRSQPNLRRSALASSAICVDSVTRPVLCDALKLVDPKLAQPVEAHKFHSAMLQRQAEQGGSPEGSSAAVDIEVALDVLISHGVHCETTAGLKPADASAGPQTAPLSCRHARLH